MNKANELPCFTASRGHHYVLPVPKPSLSSSDAQASKEGTPVPGSQCSKPSTKNSTVAHSTSSMTKEAQLLEDSYRLAMRYSNEYMDETPLVGEPGAFIFNKQREAPQPVASRPDTQPASPSEKEPPKIETTTVDLPPRKPTKCGEKTPISPGTKEKKSRRKSKAASATAVSTPK